MKIHISQCDSCAFRIIEDQSTPESCAEVDRKYQVLHAVGGHPKKLRNLTADMVYGNDKTETCYVDSPLWPSKTRESRCPDRIEDCLSLETALGIRMTKEANLIASEALNAARISASSASDNASAALEQARWARWMAIIATIAAIIATKDQIFELIRMILK